MRCTICKTIATALVGALALAVAVSQEHRAWRKPRRRPGPSPPRLSLVFPPTLPDGKDGRHRHVRRVPQAAGRARAKAWPSPRRRRPSISSTTPARPTRASPGPTGATAWPRTASTTPRSATTWPPRATPSSTSTTPRRRRSASCVDVRAAAEPARRALHAGQDPRPARPGRRRLALLLHAPRLADASPPTSTTTRATGSSARHPKTGKTEVVVQGPVPKHCIPNSVLDPERLIFYGGTAPAPAGGENDGIQFFAYDVKTARSCSTPGRTARRGT